MIPSTGQASIEGLLQSAFEKTDSREYTGALNFLKNALTIEPQNIYLGALRRQLETMLELEHNEEPADAGAHGMCAARVAANGASARRYDTIITSTSHTAFRKIREGAVGGF